MSFMSYNPRHLIFLCYCKSHAFKISVSVFYLYAEKQFIFVYWSYTQQSHLSLIIHLQVVMTFLCIQLCCLGIIKGFFPFDSYFISFSCHISPTRTSSTMLHRSGDPLSCSQTQRENFHHFTIKCDICSRDFCRFCFVLFLRSKKFSSIPSLLRGFLLLIMNV